MYEIFSSLWDLMRSSESHKYVLMAKILEFPKLSTFASFFQPGLLYDGENIYVVKFLNNLQGA